MSKKKKVKKVLYVCSSSYICKNYGCNECSLHEDTNLDKNHYCGVVESQVEDLPIKKFLKHIKNEIIIGQEVICGMGLGRVSEVLITKRDNDFDLALDDIDILIETYIKSVSAYWTLDEITLISPFKS